MTAAVIAAAFAIRTDLRAQTEPAPSAPPSLRTARIPEVDDLDDYVRSRRWAVVLGKALFWDQQVGSDGVACATCHFHAGADSRVRNQLSPSLNHQDPAKAGRFDPTRTGGGGPNYRLLPGDFPTHVLADPDDRESDVLFDSDDVVSSAGVFRAAFRRVGSPSVMFDECQPLPDPQFNLGALNTRRVEPRNTPTVINAVFNFRNFWDGRANNVFNGQNPFGPRDVNAKVLRWRSGRLSEVAVRLQNSSLASQAVGPPLSEFEMSCSGRTWPDVGRKLLDRQPLEFQRIAADDSVLTGLVDPSGYGMAMTYRQLVQLAFQSAWWSAPATRMTPSGYTQAENNFALFFGLAVQLYESTLVSDRAPYDAFAEGNSGALTESQRRGLDVFLGQGKCINCHKGPDFTGAGLALQPTEQIVNGVEVEHTPNVIERMLMGEGRLAIYDDGFYNIGVRPTVEDLGVGGTDPFGNPLSFTRQWLRFLNTGTRTIDRFGVNPGEFEVPVPLPSRPSLTDLRNAFGNDPDAVDGAFKVPGLRNVELTGPYFHNGSRATLEQVVEFYDRGGDRRSRSGGGNTSGFGPNPSNLDPDIEPLGLSSQQQSDLVAFLRALTDDRVRQESAPFDHPELAIPHGHAPAAHGQLGAPMAEDLGFVLPAIGRGGRRALGLPPVPTFEQLLQ